MAKMRCAFIACLVVGLPPHLFAFPAHSSELSTEEAHALGSPHDDDTEDAALKSSAIRSSLEPEAQAEEAWQERRARLRARKASLSLNPPPAKKSGIPSTEGPAPALPAPLKYSGGIEDFEGSFPGSYWFSKDSDAANGLVYWDDVDCMSYEGSRSSWCADIDGPANCTQYVNSQDTIMWVECEYEGVAADDTDEFYYRRWVEVQDTYDYFEIQSAGYVENPGHDGSASPDEEFIVRVDTDTGGWQSRYVRLGERFDGCSYLRIAFRFHSNGSVVEGQGAYVDLVEFNNRASAAVFPIQNGFPDPRPDFEALSVYFRTEPDRGGEIVELPVVGQQLYAHVSYLVDTATDLSGRLWEITLNGSTVSACVGTWPATDGWSSRTGWSTTATTITEGANSLCGYLDPEGTFEERNETNNGTCRTYQVSAAEVASIAGTVQDAVTGDPIHVASVTWGQYSAFTGVDGTYSLDSVPCQTDSLEVTKAGYGPYTEQYTPSCGSVNNKDIELTPTDVDVDGDGMDDSWETANGLDPGNRNDAAWDRDSDGLTNLEEFELGTDPRDPDDPPSDVYVANASVGSDVIGEGTQTDPWETIAAAVERVSPSATQLHPVTVHLASGVYQEKVSLSPHVGLAGAAPGDPEATIIQHFDANATEHIVVTTAENTRIRDCMITFPDVYVTSVALVRIKNTRVEIQNVVFDGRFNQASTAILVSGQESSNSLIRHCTFRRVRDAIWAVDSSVNVTRNSFDYVLNDAVFVYLPDKKQMKDALTPLLGDSALAGTTGFNTFGAVDGKLINSVNPARITLAEYNDWGIDVEQDIGDKMAGDVDFLPFVGQSLTPGALAVHVLDASLRVPVGPLANPAVTIVELDLAAMRDDVSGVFTVQGLEPGAWTVAVEADGYEPQARVVSLGTQHVSAEAFYLFVEGTAPAGDVNADGVANAVDVQLVINGALGLDTSGHDCDLDQDGTINAIDVQLVVNAALGLYGKTG